MSTSNKYRFRRAEDATFRTAIQRVMALMSSSDRRRLWYLIPVASLNALVQVAGIASVMPFLALVANPQFVRDQAQLAWVYDTLGFRSPDAFVIFAGFAALAALVLTNVAAAGTQLMMLNFSWSLNHSLSTSMLRTYLAKPYVFFLNQNTAGLTKNILGEVKQMVNGFVIAGLNLIARSVVVIAILGLLLVVEPLLAISTFALLGTAYGSVFAMVQRGITEAGRHRSAADRARFKAVTEALTGIKAIKLLGMESAFVRHYETPSKVYSRYMARQQVIGFLPRYALETIAFGGMLIIVLFQLMRGSGVSTFLPTLGVFALAAYRLLPALQGIFGSLTDLRFSVASIELLFKDLEPRVKGRSPQDAVAPVRLGAGLELRNVTFAYPNARHPVLEDFSLRIVANTTVAFVGTTGAGKTTVVDLILGLLRPQSGSLFVDGVPVGEDDLRAWQMSLGYVPQDIYLADDTVAGNIAFGVPPDDIDIAAVERAARLASIHDFISEELPSGYATEVGERGVRLSGGQRQRLGIARALFHDPPILILDEATSALDSVTEESIFHSVHEIGRSKTVVMIAHRISTVQKCDVIFVLDSGRVVASGSFGELLASSPEFRALAKSGSEPVHAT